MAEAGLAHGRTPRIAHTQRSALALFVLSGVVNYIDHATLAVANPLIREELGLSVGDRGLLLSALLWAYAFAWMRTNAVTRLTGRWAARAGASRTCWRGAASRRSTAKWPMAASLAGTGVFTMLAAWMPSNAVAIGCISAAMFLCYVSTATGWAMASVAAPANCTASLGAMQNFGGYLGGALALTVTGFIAEASGSFVPAMLVGAGIAPVCAGAYATVVKDPIPAAELDPQGAVAPAE